MTPARLVAPTLLFALLAGCAAPAGPRPAPPPLAASASDTGLDRMERLVLAADRCWFDSNDPSFAPYSLAPELASFSGRPRFLLVPRGRPEARPLLVVEGQSGSTEVSVYGPLMGQPVGARAASDLARWGRGGASCAA